MGMALSRVKGCALCLGSFLQNVLKKVLIVFIVLVLILGVYLWFYQDKLVFFPAIESSGKRELSANKPGERHPSEMRLNSEDVALITDDRVKLHSWFIYHKKNEGHRKQAGSTVKARLDILDRCSKDLGGDELDQDFGEDKEGVDANVQRKAPFYLRQCFRDYYKKYETIEKVPTIIYFHGNAGNIGHRLSRFWELYNFIGVNIFAVSYRGYGNSDGVPSEAGFYLDAKAAYEYVLSRTDVVDRNKIFVYGHSIGGAVAIDLASKYSVSGLILENTFKDMRTTCSRVYPIFSRIPFFLDVFQRLKFDSYSKMRNVKSPTLYIVGMMDELVFPTDSIELYRNSGTDPKLSRIFTVSTGSHNNTWMEAGLEYFKILFKFIYDTQNINDQDYSLIRDSEARGGHEAGERGRAQDQVHEGDEASVGTLRSRKKTRK